VTALIRFNMALPETIYMPLLDEGVEVWAPVAAEPLGEGQYRILGPVPDDQEWRFSPGEIVRVELRTFADGKAALSAVG
jgi:hypothetical protein